MNKNKVIKLIKWRVQNLSKVKEEKTLRTLAKELDHFNGNF